MTYRSDKGGDRRRSFVVFEDDADSVCSKSKQPEFATELGTTRNGRPAARSKSGTLGESRTLKPGVSGEQTASRESVLEKPKHHALKSITAFRARAKGMLNSNSFFTTRLLCTKQAATEVGLPNENPRHSFQSNQLLKENGILHSSLFRNRRCF